MKMQIRGTGMYVPPDIVDNHRLSRVIDTSDEWIQQRTGIVTRRFAREGVGTSDIALFAAEDAVKDAGIAKEDVDAVIFATMTPDHYFPGAGSEFQYKFGLPPVPCLDIRQQCAGFLYGLQVADAYIASGRYRTVLLIGAEVHGGFMPWKAWDILLDGSDRQLPEAEYRWNSQFRDRAVLFGDGAGAVVLAPGDDGPGLIDLMVRTDGRHWDKMWTPGGGSLYRPYFTHEMIDRGDIVPIVEGQEVFRVAVTVMPEAVNDILRKNGYTIADLDLLVMHQANLRINEMCRRKLELPEEKVFNNIQKYGNTTAATIPMAFHEARLAGKARPGDLVCFVGLGSGLNWGAALYRC